MSGIAAKAKLLFRGNARFIQDDVTAGPVSTSLKYTDRTRDGRSSSKFGKLLDKITFRKSRRGGDPRLKQNEKLKLRDGQVARIARKNGDLDFQRLGKALSPNSRQPVRNLPSQSALPAPPPITPHEAETALQQVQSDRAARLNGQNNNGDNAELAALQGNLRAARDTVERGKASSGLGNWFRLRSAKKQLSSARTAFDSKAREVKHQHIADLRALHALERKINEAARQGDPARFGSQRQAIAARKREIYKALVEVSVPGLNENNPEFHRCSRDLHADYDALLDSLMQLDANIENDDHKAQIESVLNRVVSHGFTRDWADTTETDVVTALKDDLEASRNRLQDLDDQYDKLEQEYDALTRKLVALNKSRNAKQSDINQIKSDSDEVTNKQSGIYRDQHALQDQIKRLANQLKTQRTTGLDGAKVKKQQALRSMRALVDGLNDGTTVDFTLAGNDRLDDLRLALKERAAANNSNDAYPDESATLTKARHDLSTAQRQLAAGLRITNRQGSLGTWKSYDPDKAGRWAGDPTTDRVFSGDAMGDVRMDAALFKALRSASTDGKPLLDKRSNLLMAKVRLMQDKVDRLSVNNAPDTNHVATGRQQFGCLADYGIDRDTAKLLLTPDEQRTVNPNRQLSFNQKRLLIDKIDKLIAGNMTSVEHADAATKLVGGMHGTLTGHTSRLAGKVLTETQESWSPEIQSRAFVSKVLQNVTGENENFALSASDVAVVAQGFHNLFDRAEPDRLTDKSMAVTNATQSLAGLHDQIAQAHRELNQAKRSLDNALGGDSSAAAKELRETIDRRASRLENLVGKRDRLLATRHDWLNDTFQPPGIVDTAIRAAVLAARPKGTPLDHYDPTNHIPEIERTLDDWGLDPALVRPEINEATSTALDRDVLDRWRKDFEPIADNLPGANAYSEVRKRNDAFEFAQKSDAQRLAHKEAAQLCASVEEFTPGSYLYCSSSSVMSSNFTAKFLGWGVSTTNSKQNTTELKVSAGAGGYSVTLYAGPGVSFSPETSAKLATVAGVSVSGSIGNKPFSGFNFNFKDDGREPSAMARMQTFIQKVATDEDFNIDDLITLTDGTSLFTQDQDSTGGGVTGKAGVEHEIAVGPASIDLEAQVKANVSYNWFKKDKYEISADSTSHDVLKMYKLTGQVSASAGAKASVDVNLHNRNVPVKGDDGQNQDEELSVGLTPSVGLGAGIGAVRTGVIYAWSGRTRKSDTGTYTSASCGFSAWDGSPGVITQNDSWKTLEHLSTACGCHDEFAKWKNNPEYQQFRDDFQKLIDERSGADFVKIDMSIKPEKLDEANRLIDEARLLEHPAMLTTGRKSQATALRKQAQQIIDDRDNYEPARVGFAPTEEWSGSNTIKAGSAGLKLGDIVNVSGSGSKGDSTWGEFSLVRKVSLPQPTQRPSRSQVLIQSTTGPSIAPVSQSSPTQPPTNAVPSANTSTSQRSSVGQSQVSVPPRARRVPNRGLVSDNNMMPEAANIIDKPQLFEISAKINGMYKSSHKPTSRNRFYKQRQNRSLCAVHAANVFFGGPMLHHEAFTNWKMANNLNEDFDISRRSQLDARHGSHPFELVGYLNFLNDRGLVDGRVEEVPVTTGPIPDVAGDRCIIGYDKPSAHFVTFRKHENAWYKIDSRGDRGPTELQMSPEQFIQTLRHANDQRISLIQPVQGSGVE